MMFPSTWGFASERYIIISERIIFIPFLRAPVMKSLLDERRKYLVTTYSSLADEKRRKNARIRKTIAITLDGKRRIKNPNKRGNSAVIICSANFFILII